MSDQVRGPLAALRRSPLPGSQLLVLLTAAYVWLEFVSPVRRSDLLVFLHAGDVVSGGGNPFTRPDDPLLWGGSAYVYPYLVAFAFLPLAHLPIGVADLLWYAGSVAGIWFGCWCLRLRNPVAVAAVLLCATSVRSFQVGSLNPVLFLALAVMWRYRERARVVATAFVVMVGTKLFLLPMLVWIALTRPRRTLLLAAGSAAGFLALCAVTQPISIPDFVTSTRELARHESLQGMSFRRLAHELVPAAEHLAPLLVAAATCAVAVLAIATRLLQRDRPLDEQADRLVFLATLTAALVLTPIFWTHYMLLALLVPLLLRPRTSTALVLAVGSWLVSRPAGTHLPYPPDLVTSSARFFGLLLLVLLGEVVRVAVSRQGLPRTGRVSGFGVDRGAA